MRYDIITVKGKRVTVVDKTSNRVTLLNREESVQFRNVHAMLLAMRDGGMKEVYQKLIEDLCATVTA